jgi:hypothetical protein
MAPYEYKVCATAHPTRQQAWNVSIWTRRTSSNGQEAEWVCRHRTLVDGVNWPHMPKACWPLILARLKV